MPDDESYGSAYPSVKALAQILSKLSYEAWIQLCDTLGKELNQQAKDQQKQQEKQLANMTLATVYALEMMRNRFELMEHFVERPSEKERKRSIKPSVLRGYHGTTTLAAMDILHDIADGNPRPFKESANQWDWLGHGVYFWLEAPQRAAEHVLWWYGIMRKQRPWLPDLFDLNRYPPPPKSESHFAVIEARIRLFPETSINLLDTSRMEELKQFSNEFQQRISSMLEPARTLAKSNYRVVTQIKTIDTSQGLMLQKIKSATEVEAGEMRTRDCQLFNEFVKKYRSMQCIIAAFREGDQLIQGINVWDKDHVQINVLDQSIIDFESVTIHDAVKFLPPGAWRKV